MNTNNNQFERFEFLLQSRDYDTLSATEKKLVAQYCDSAEEYILMQQLTNTPAPNQSLDPKIEQTLLETIERKKPSEKPSHMTNFKIPLWVFLLSLFGASGFMYWLGSAQSQSGEVIKSVPKEIIKEVPKEIIKRDTIVQFAYKTDTIFLKEKKVSNHKRQVKNVVARTPSKAVLVKQSVKSQVKRRNQLPEGRTIKQDPKLKEFMTGIQ